MMKLETAGLVLVLVAGSSPSGVLFAQDEVGGPTAVQEQNDEHFDDVIKVLTTLGTPETVYDYLTFGISGPVVVLQGFTVNGALRDNAKAQIQKLDWVTHVVQEVELLPVGPEMKRIRQQILGILKKQVPQAFARNHTTIRIGVNGDGEVTLIGAVGPSDGTRYLAAVERIKHVTFVTAVTDKVTKATEDS